MARLSVERHARLSVLKIRVSGEDDVSVPWRSSR
jgi:hypothetical protein